MSKPDPILLITDAMGVYIPRNFATYFGDKRSEHVANIKDEDWKVLEAGPYHEWYWESWQTVCDDAVVTDTKGNKYMVYQDGDCWLIPRGMEFNERTEQWVWPTE